MVGDLGADGGGGTLATTAPWEKDTDLLAAFGRRELAGKAVMRVG